MINKIDNISDLFPMRATTYTISIYVYSHFFMLKLHYKAFNSALKMTVMRKTMVKLDHWFT